jgi:uncharacterized protein (TIGR00106 family)
VIAAHNPAAPAPIIIIGLLFIRYYSFKKLGVMMSALLEFAMFPTEQTQSKSAFVARVLDIVDKSGLEYQLTPMGTIIEGETVEEVLAVINKAYEELQIDCDRVYSSIKIDYRKGPVGRLNNKVASVEAKLGRKLKS